MKDYRAILLAANEQAVENVRPLKQRMNEAYNDYKAAEKLELEKVQLIMEEYFNEVLLDRNGAIVKVNYVISLPELGKPAYKVISRDMQWLFGTPMMNPAVEVLRYYSDGTLGKKSKRLHRSDLEEMQIILDLNTTDDE